ncbi:hypothetical protein VNO78_15693 [Psophocarpus tetragonolobus]|uniref:Uncharacterized protein n=1 Tax=Psophocarpus tetragonolobus TaxID=3891 RepID=A0AAN9SGI2_PSOTE
MEGKQGGCGWRKNEAVEIEDEGEINIDMLGEVSTTTMQESIQSWDLAIGKLEFVDKAGFLLKWTDRGEGRGGCGLSHYALRDTIFVL